MAHDFISPPGFKTTLYYAPDGRCEAAYVEFAAGSAVRKVEPDPRYLVTVYFDEGDVALGVRIEERVPQAVIDKTVEMVTGAPPSLKSRMAQAQASIGAAA